MEFLRRCTWYRPQRCGPDFAAAPQQDSFHSDHEQNPWGLFVVGPEADREGATIQSCSLLVRSSVSTMQSSSRWFGALFPEDFGGHIRDGPASPWSSREFQDLEGACDVRRGSAFLCQLGYSHESASTPELALSALARPGKMRRRTHLQRPTFRIMSLRSTTCSVQGNGCRGVLRLLFFHVAGHRVLEGFFFFGRYQYRWRISLGDGGSIPSQNCDYDFPSLRLRTPEQRFILIGWLGLCRGLRSAISVALDRLRTSSPVCLFLRNRGVVPSCDTVGFGFVLIAVFAGIFKLSFPSIATAFAAVEFASAAWYRVTLTFPFTRSFENSPCPREAEGLHPHMAMTGLMAASHG